MSHKQVDIYDRVRLFQMAYIYLMKIRVMYESRPVGPGVKPFWRKAAGPKDHRLMFEYQLLIHTTNTIAGIVYEIRLARMPTSLQQISTVPVEKKFGKTKIHAGVHKTVIVLIKTMKDDEAMQFIYAQDQVKNLRLTYGETLSPCTFLTGIGITPLIYVEAVIYIVEFPAMISPLLGETTTDKFHIFVEKLMSEVLSAFAKTNFNMTSARKRCSLYQELHGVAPSSCPIILSSKSKMRGVSGWTAIDAIEQHLGALLGQHWVLSEELKLLVVQACEAADVHFEGAHALNRSTKREVFEWIGENCDALGETFITIAAHQRTGSGRSRG
jgi:hypothetical protein